jgi:hypothetical protein
MRLPLLAADDDGRPFMFVVVVQGGLAAGLQILLDAKDGFSSKSKSLIFST